MKYILDHTVLLNRYLWDIVLLIVTLAVMIVLFLYCRKKIKDMKEEKEQLEDKLSGDSARDVFENAENRPAPIAEEQKSEEAAQEDPEIRELPKEPAAAEETAPAEE